MRRFLSGFIATVALGVAAFYVYWRIERHLLPMLHRRQLQES